MMRNAAARVAVVPALAGWSAGLTLNVRPSLDLARRAASMNGSGSFPDTTAARFYFAVTTAPMRQFATVCIVEPTVPLPPAGDMSIALAGLGFGGGTGLGDGLGFGGGTDVPPLLSSVSV
jgi:hypothetical protein